MKVLLSFLLLLASPLVLHTQPLPPGLSWHFYETPNFEIVAIDKNHGVYLNNNIEYIRRWSLDRWGMPSSGNFGTKCKILIVPDKEMYVKLFNKDQPQVRTDKDGKASIWLWADPRWQVQQLPVFVTEVALADMERRSGKTIPFFLKNGMCLLNSNFAKIKGEISELRPHISQALPCFWTKTLFAMTPSGLAKYTPEQQSLFHRECMCFCLLVEKELGGQTKFLEFMNSFQNNKDGNIAILGMTSNQKLDETFYRYMTVLSQDVALGKTPNRYFNLGE